MIEKWVNFKRDYLEISFLRESGCVPFRRITDDIWKYPPGLAYPDMCRSRRIAE